MSYGDGQASQTYDQYLDGLDQVWLQCERVLWPNGKLAINTAIMPIPKKVIRQRTRHLKPIPHDIHHRVMAYTGLELLDVFIWQKQTTSHMLGAYPHPGNNLADNSIEHIFVYRKPGHGRVIPADMKALDQMSELMHIDLTQQVWWIHTGDVKRLQRHPAPFPIKLPGRLIRLYTCTSNSVILDPFLGTGTTAVAAKRMGRRWLGIDTSQMFLDAAATYRPQFSCSVNCTSQIFDPDSPFYIGRGRMARNVGAVLW